MNESQLRQLVFRFESQDAMTMAETSTLQRALQDRPELLGEILDRRAIDGMLQLLAVDEMDDDFVGRCVSGLSGQSFSSNENPLAGEHKSSDQDIALATIARLARRANSSPQRKWKKIEISRWLAVAASIAVLLGAWAGFAWYTRSRIVQPLVTAIESPKVNDQANTETIPPRIHDESLTDSSEKEIDPVVMTTEPERTREIQLAPENAEHLLADDDRNSPTRDEVDVDGNRVGATEANGSAEPPIVRNAMRPMIAAVEHSPDASWEGGDPSNEVGGGSFSLLTGNASLKLENGVSIRALGPSRFDLNSGDSIRLESGNFLAEIPRKVDQFMISTQFGILENPVNTTIQISVDPDQGIETFVTRGQIRLCRSTAGEYPDQIELAKNGLFQSIVRPIADRPTISGLMMARGKNEFQGQIGFGKDAVKVESPVIFANVLNRINEQPQSSEANDEFSKNWLKFAQNLQALAGNSDSPEFRKLIDAWLGENNLADPAQKIGDVFENGTTNFQGSLSINGVERKFNSREEYEQARRQMFGGLPRGLPDIPAQNNGANSGTNKRASDFKGVISVNGKTLEFTSPDKFRALRKQMTR